MTDPSARQWELCGRECEHKVCWALHGKLRAETAVIGAVGDRTWQPWGNSDAESFVGPGWCPDGFQRGRIAE